MKSPEKLEAEFDEFFNCIGFQRVADVVENTPDFQNADYIQLDHHIIVELKVNDKDFFQDGGIIDSQRTVVSVPVDIDEEGFGQYRFSLPIVGRTGRPDTLEEPLRRILKKANKQLRETNEILLNDEGVGFVVLALNMETAIDPEKIRELAGHILSREFSSIAGFIVCTPSWILQHPITGDIVPACLPTTSDNVPSWIREEK